MKLRKVVIKEWVHVPPGLFSRGGGRVKECGDCMYFLEVVVGRFKRGKVG